MRAVDPIILPGQIQRQWPQWIVRRAAFDHFGPFRIAFAHRWGGSPGRIDHLVHNRCFAPAGQVIGHRNAGGVKLVDTLIRTPEMQGAGLDIDQDRAVVQRREIRLPMQRAKTGYVAPDGPGNVALDLGRVFLLGIGRYPQRRRTQRRSPSGHNPATIPRRCFVLTHGSAPIPPDMFV